MSPRRTTTIGVALAIAASAMAGAHAQDEGWAKAMALPAGAHLRITSFDGTRSTGRVERVSADAVRLELDAPVSGVAQVQVPRGEVRMLERLGRRSWRGTAIGAGLGAVAGLVTLLSVEPKDARASGVRTSHELPVMLGMAGIGAGAGAVTDVIRRPPVEVLYVAPVPGAAAHGSLIEPGFEIISMGDDRGHNGRRTARPDGIAERHLCQSP
jgi:hypothetical protein